MTKDEQYMNRCLDLALLGKNRVIPNPMVGSVIVYDDKIIGEGYHEKYGESHAEVNAVNSVQDKSLLCNSTIYVSLEPCSHFGNTPPCCNLLQEYKFKRVVVGCKDPNKEVFGHGIQSLIDSNIEVSVGILEEKCRQINHTFFTFHEKERPYITLKWAQSTDGFIDKHGEQIWISCEETQSLVHQWRADHQSIMVGRKTVEVDNPSLNVRNVDGTNPIRIIIDPKNQISKKSKVLNQVAKTIVLNEKLEKTKSNIHYHKIDSLNADSIVNKIYSLGIQSVLIEGGRHTLQSFIDSNLWDKAHVIIGDVELQNGTEAPNFPFTPVKTDKFYSDTIKYFVNT